ncbi:TonB-dependent receptor [Acidicapsa acidisoli]|uniref:TonB-dependent receptor n=1 Tax=Acidicapsa acidisoli TaxID=1615681 RepID=UPI0021DFDD4D|nr:TonB-dependent receptor [Acidicapsa acidisoli]
MLQAETKLCVVKNEAGQKARTGVQPKVHSGRAMIFAHTIVLLVLASLAASTMSAQETRATLSGTVFDPSSATIVGATLKLTNIATGVSATATSNTDGQYRFLFVDPGTYTLSTEAQGFQTFVENGIVLNVSQASTIDVRMALGSQSSTVTVTSDQPLLETEKSDRGVVLSTSQVEEVPLAVRNPIELVEAVPGVTQVTQRYDLLPFTNSGNSAYSFNGMNGDATENLLDGAPNDMLYTTNALAYIPAVDAVAEFKAITAPFDAQYGRNGGGVISVATKSGTNAFHGTAYDFINRPWLFANTYANDAAHVKKSNQSLNEYGYTLGGPVRIPHIYNGTDKTFFFNSWEGYNELINLVTGTSVPTALQRQGDFSQTFNSSGQLITIYDPNSGHLVNGVWTRDPFPGNKIPANEIDPVGQALANAYPLPNTNQNATVNWQNNYLGNNVTDDGPFHNVLARIDHTFSDREKMYVRYAWNKAYITGNSNNLPGIGADLRDGTKVNNDVVADSVSVLTPNVVLDLRASLTRWTQNFLPNNWTSFNGTDIGLPAATVAQFQSPHWFPYTTVTNYQYLGSSSGNIVFEPTTALTAEPTLILTKGRESIKFGLDWRWTRFDDFTGAYGGGTFGITPGFTQQNYLVSDPLSGNSIASMLVGGAATGEADVLPKPYYSLVYYGLWVQDDIKLTPRLTVNAGLRYDIQTPITDRHNQLTHGFDFAGVNPISAAIGQNVYGGLGFVGVGGNSRSPFNVDLTSFQPRFGAAYRLRTDIALRGGWGIFYVPQYSQASSSGFSQTTPYVGTLNNGETIANPLSNPFPSGILAPTGSSAGLATLNGKNPSFSDPSGRIGHVQVFSFGLQKEFPARITLDLAYAGSRANQIPVQGLNIDALTAANLALGNSDLGGSSSYLTKQVPNPFQGLLPTTSLNGPTISRQQSLLPFPEFTSVTENDVPLGHYWYNAFQLNMQQHSWHHFDTMVSYTFSKSLEAITYLNPQDAFVHAPALQPGSPDASTFTDDSLTSPTHSYAPYDRKHRIDFTPVYELPFGKGRELFSGANKVVNVFISGWQGSGHILFQTGAPMTGPAGVALVGNPGVPNKSWLQMFNSGTTQLNGTVTNQVAGLAPAWRVLPAFALRTVPLQMGNIRDRWGTETNLTLSKNNYIHETMNLQLRVEFLNAFNHPIFGGDPNINYTSPQFGQLIRANGQTNVPRTIQPAIRFVF